MQEREQPPNPSVHLSSHTLVESASLEPRASFPAIYDLPLDFLEDVHQVVMVEQVQDVLPAYLQQGYSIAVEPYRHPRGTCTVLQDQYGNRIGLIDQDSVTQYQKPQVTRH